LKILSKYYFNLFLTILFVHLYISAKSQDTLPSKSDDSNVQQLLENAAEDNNSEDIDYSDILESLNNYKTHPINLNNAKAEDLRQLRILNDIQINNLLTHIEKNGKLITIYELQGISGFDLQTIYKLLPYIRVNNNFESAHFSLKEMFRSGQNSTTFRYARVIEPQIGFVPTDSSALYKSPNSRYIGSPDKLYLKYRFTYANNVSWGITAEKDQGELFFKNNQKFKYDWYNQSLKGNQKTGFDFYSAHVFLHNIKFIKALAIGDYQVTFGQGLVAWSSFAFGKGADLTSVKKSATGIHPYASVDENKFMRGVATTIGYKSFEATAFFSRKHVDANVSDTLENGEIAAISSLQTTGYHTTSSEIADKHSILQTIYGGNLSYKRKKFNAGITAANYELNHEFNRSLSYYNKFEFSSKQNFNGGINYNFLFRNFNFFGEAAMSQNGGKAFVNGALIMLDTRLSLTILHRYYERNYQNLLSAGFAESTTASNEKGLYIGLVIKPNNVTTVTAFYDRFEFPWLKYQVNAPSHGNDYMVQFNYTPNKKTDMYIRIRQRNKEKNSTAADAVIDFLVPTKQTNCRFDVVYSVLPAVKLKSRVELIEYKLGDNKTQQGYLAYQDIIFSKLGKPFSFSMRYALFETDSYDSRLYAYENDVPGSYSIPAYYYRGSRFYLMLDYNVTRSIEVWVRYSQTYYENQNTISAGSLTEINGKTKSEIKAEIKFKF